MDDDQRLAHTSILSSIRNLHRQNAEARNSARARLNNRNILAAQRDREQATIRFTEVYERELNIAIHAAEEAFRISAGSS